MRRKKTTVCITRPQLKKKKLRRVRLAVPIVLVALACMIGAPSAQLFTVKEIHLPSALLPAVSRQAHSEDLFAAILQGDALIVQHLLDDGIDPNEKTNDSVPAIVLAAKCGQAGIVDLLLTNDADPYAEDGAGMTAMDYAELQQNTRLMETMGAYGVSSSPEFRKAETNRTRFAAAGAQGAQQRMSRAQQLKFSQQANPGTGPITGETSARPILRLAAEPTWVWTYDNEIAAQNIRVSIRNDGDATARKVRVEALLPDRTKKLAFAGPADLPGRSKADYLALGKAKLGKAGKIEAKVSCENCR
ncbi:MAG TPA: ankyrin repeat domain-containing protein [Oligoflexia bacterium]|nr:ankyrin repeat domain-containing protein [Oligoflexia bacterium]